MAILQVYRAVKYYYIVESRTVWPNLWRVVNLIHILLILAHWFGCFYFLLSEAEGFQVNYTKSSLYQIIRTHKMKKKVAKKLTGNKVYLWLKLSYKPN